MDADDYEQVLQGLLVLGRYLEEARFLEVRFLLMNLGYLGLVRVKPGRHVIEGTVDLLQTSNLFEAKEHLQPTELLRLEPHLLDLEAA